MQLPPGEDCIMWINNLNPKTPVNIPYAGAGSGTTTVAKNYFTFFDNLYELDCTFDYCYLYNGGCGTSYTAGNIEIGLYPYPLSAY